METIDCVGLACPSPVLKTKELIESKMLDCLMVLVDNEAARQNVSRFLQSRGFDLRVEEMEKGFAVIGNRSGDESACRIMTDEQLGISESKILLMVGSDRVGTGDDTLGRKLMLNFLTTLNEMEGLWRLVFVNSGVKLAVEGAETLPAIQALERSGVSVLVCGTCLTFFDLMDKKRVGETTNMLDIVTSLQVAEKVITFS